jgi:hypothetical protein
MLIKEENGQFTMRPSSDAANSLKMALYEQKHLRDLTEHNKLDPFCSNVDIIPGKQILLNVEFKVFSAVVMNGSFVPASLRALGSPASCVPVPS